MNDIVHISKLTLKMASVLVRGNAWIQFEYSSHFSTHRKIIVHADTAKADQKKIIKFERCGRAYFEIAQKIAFKS